MYATVSHEKAFHTKRGGRLLLARKDPTVSATERLWEKRRMFNSAKFRGIRLLQTVRSLRQGQQSGQSAKSQFVRGALKATEPEGICRQTMCREARLYTPYAQGVLPTKCAGLQEAEMS